MKVRILLALLCAITSQTQAFFGSQMLSTAWTATASFCKEHPVAVATVAAVCGISYWLYKKYIKTSSAATTTATSATPAGHGDATATGGATEDAVREEVQDEFAALLESFPDAFDDFDTFESLDDITFEAIDYSVSVTEDVLRERLQYLKIGEKIYSVGCLEYCTRCGQGCYGFKIMIGEKTVGVLIGEKASNSSILKILMFVLYKNLCTDQNYKNIIQKIKNDNPTIIKLEANFFGITFSGIKEQQRAIYKKFGFKEPRETNFEMSLMQESSAASSTRMPSVSGAGAASATDQSHSDEESDDTTPQPSPVSTPLRPDATPRASGAGATSVTATSLFDNGEGQADEDFFINAKRKTVADAGAAGAAEDDALSFAGSDFTTTGEQARLAELEDATEGASEGAAAASEVKVDIQFINVKEAKILESEMQRLGQYYAPMHIKTIVQNDGFGIWVDSALVGIVIYEKKSTEIKINFLALKDNFYGKIIIEKIIEELRKYNREATQISATLNNVFHTEKQISLYHAFGLHRKKHASGGDTISFYRKF